MTKIISEETLPFLRWAGGKRWLSKKIAFIIRKRLQGCYYEPFLGAGAMFFAVAPHHALLSDTNSDLINAFQAVKYRHNDLIKKIHEISVDSNTYYKIRASKPRTPFSRAVRFIFLNRTCYGGLYRENKNGIFNTPYGGGSRTPAPLWEKGLLQQAQKLLSSENVICKTQDFEKTIKLAKHGDIIYCDPTYRSVNRRQFDRYGSSVFDWKDQKRLANEANQAANRGALVIISNTYCDEVRALYPDAIFLCLHRNKTIGNRNKNDNSKKEFLIILDKKMDISIWSSFGIFE
jgi:DNA adenine methylase